MQTLPPRAGNRRDTLMKWPRRFFDTLLREALASDVTWSNVHWKVKFKRSKFINFLAYLDYFRVSFSFRQFYLICRCIIHFIREEVQPQRHVQIVSTAVDDRRVGFVSRDSDCGFRGFRGFREFRFLGRPICLRQTGIQSRPVCLGLGITPGLQCQLHCTYMNQFHIYHLLTTLITYVYYRSVKSSVQLHITLQCRHFFGRMCPRSGPDKHPLRTGRAIYKSTTCNL